jgi:hypothetical protein
LLTETLNP